MERSRSAGCYRHKTGVGGCTVADWQARQHAAVGESFPGGSDLTVQYAGGGGREKIRRSCLATDVGNGGEGLAATATGALDSQIQVRAGPREALAEDLERIGELGAEAGEARSCE